MKTLSITQTLIALLPLVAVVGYLGQLHDDSYLLPGFIFAWLLMLYLLFALRWYRYRPVTLVAVWVAALGAMALMIKGGGVGAGLAALPVWAVLQFGPKQATAAGESLEHADSGQRNKQLRGLNLQATFWWLAVGLVGSIAMATPDDWLRRLDLAGRYQQKECATVTVLKQAVLCYDAQRQLRLVDAFFDYKGRRISYRLAPIHGEQAVQTVVGYGTGRLSRRHEVRFAIEGDTIQIVRHGYGVMFDEQGQADLADGLMRYENDELLDLQPVTPEALQRLWLDPAGEG